MTTRKLVTAETKENLEKRVNEYIKRGWKRVGKVTVEHRVFTSLYTQVMEWDRTSKNH